MSSRRASWHVKANTPVVGWLLLVLVTSFVHPLLSQSRWLLVHLLLLGAVTNAIVVWSAHFTEALLRSVPGPHARHAQALRLVLLNASVVLVVGGIETATWTFTLLGATGVAGAVVLHGCALVRQARRALPSRFGATVRYYVAAAALLPVGAALGTLLARGPGPDWHDRLLVAHASVNVLGWVGLTVAGTLVTLWPTMLRTRIADGAERAAARGLVVLLGSLAVIVGGALWGPPQATAAGLVGYLAGLVVVGRPLARAARRRPPSTYATWSVFAACCWLAGSLVVLAAAVATAPDWPTAALRAGWVTVPLAVGFAAQVLLGALSYLVPVVLGGGPSSVRAADATLARGGALRITAIDLGLLVCVLPVPSVVRVACSLLVLAGLAAFLPLLVAAVRSSRRETLRRDPPPSTSQRQRGRQTAPVAVGLAAVVLAVAGGAAADPSALAGAPEEDAAAGVAATGHTTRVEIEARHMRFTPATIELPAGDRLVIVVRNADDDVHDLVLETNHSSGRLSPGETASLDVGVVGRDLDGWCSVVGHRQMGMTLAIDVVGGGAAESGGADDLAHEHAGEVDPMGEVDLLAEPDAAFRAHDASLPPVPARTVHRRTFHVREVEREVAPGVRQRLWTYNGTAPGPTLRGKVGDVFEITLVNDATIGHSVDFHASALAPDGPMRTIAPGESLVYRFTARHSGIWLYHCSTMPMAAHIANGLFGAVIIDPPGLPRVDREYVAVQSEIYLGDTEVDAAKVAEERPDLVVFNGYANQYRYRPLTARVGDRVRIWVLAAGPSRGTSFHVVGGQFDTVFSEGSYLLRRGGSHAGGSQVLALGAAQGGFVELEFTEPGHYPFLNHAMVDAERGAAGTFAVRR
jgi:nitrite reductase (NO-forming)